MRLAGTLYDETLARQFGVYLDTQGIDNRIELQADKWEIWIRDDDHWRAAQSELVEFEKTPQAERFQVPIQAAAQSVKKLAPRKSPVVIIRHDTLLGHRPWITWFLVMLCVMIQIYFEIPTRTEIEVHDQNMMLSRFLFEPMPLIGDSADLFHTIRQGEYWRLLTPCFVHGGLMHLFFNMSGLFVSGGQIERVRGSFLFVAMVLVLGVVSNTAQYLVACYMLNPLPGYFVGISGVLFGLFGYRLMKHRIDPGYGFFVAEQELIFMLFYTVLGILDLFPGVKLANTAHVSGWLMGMALAWLGTTYRRAIYKK